jgi:hypothetical protein
MNINGRGVSVPLSAVCTVSFITIRYHYETCCKSVRSVNMMVLSSYPAGEWKAEQSCHLPMRLVFSCFS